MLKLFLVVIKTDVNKTEWTIIAIAAEKPIIILKSCKEIIK